ncbi:DinB family protein [Ramlibacter montanisoli]|uniref:DinB family protein n=1 Tax=Ramlibacter montanisoli TaxID=2732512 RepID=UPI0028152EB3|nr:DinB family protein [Ramlibacter montanisoli]
MRRASREQLSLALMDARNYTLQILARLEEGLGEDVRVPPSPDTVPPLWLAGHVAWLAEYWIARNPQRGLGPRCPADCVRLASIEPQADQWFDPRLAPHEERWQLPLPDANAVKAYLLDTLETTLELLEHTADEDDALYFYRMVLFHEDLRGEELVTIAQTVGVPLGLALPTGVAARPALLMPATRWTLGWSEDASFALDIERGHEPVQVPEFEIDAQPVTWAQFVEFIDDGGYDREELWHPRGWQWLQREAQQEGRRGPRHVEQIGVASGAVLQTMFGKATRMGGTQVVMHANWWEADAWRAGPAAASPPRPNGRSVPCRARAAASAGATCGNGPPAR